MPPERGFNCSLPLIVRFLLEEEVTVILWPPAKAIAGIESFTFSKALDAYKHLQIQDLVIKDVLATGAPKAQVASEPPSQVAIEIDARFTNLCGTVLLSTPFLHREKSHNQRSLRNRLFNKVLAALPASDKNP